VYFHHFFDDADGIDDKDLVPLLEQTLDREHPREWYWALMDYGVHIKQTRGNNISRSKHYAWQSAFEGSRRQVRGTIIRRLLGVELLREELTAEMNDERTESVIDDLIREGFLEQKAGRLRLTGELKLP